MRVMVTPESRKMPRSGRTPAAAVVLVLALAVTLGLALWPSPAHAATDVAATADPALVAALAAATTVPDARVEVTALDVPAAAGCRPSAAGGRAEPAGPIDGSGRIAVKLGGSRPGGARCQVTAWVRVKVYAPVPVTRRSVRAGEPLAAAVTMEEREILPGHAPAVIAEGAVADRWLGAGRVVEEGAIRAAGLRAGEAIKVLLLSGALTVEQMGRAVPCGRGRTCASLATGKQVEGVMDGGRLVVVLP
jgi:hypothetical protein